MLLLLEEKGTETKNEEKVKKLHARQALSPLEMLEKQLPDPCTLTLHSQDG